MTAVLVHTASRQAQARRSIAHVAAAGRREAERLAAQAREDRAWEVAHTTGQLCLEDQDWCFICGRATDHTGEHEPEQVEAWLAGRDKWSRG